MPLSFHSVIEPSSAPDSLRSEPWLSPPLSHKRSEEMPFKAKSTDRVSLNMKRRKGRKHGWRHLLSQHPSDTGLRKSHSLPIVQPGYAPAVIGLPTSPHQGTRRWTIPSKAAPTRGLAIIVPVQEAASRRPRKQPKSSQSPAMITLRRATASESNRRLSLTSFPPPKFNRTRGGFLSSFLNSITGEDEHCVETKSSLEASGYKTQRRDSTFVSGNDALPSTSAAAPPIHTEVIAIEAQVSLSGQDYTVDSIRRCSTRYISDDGVYEIIWDEESSSPERVTPRHENEFVLDGRPVEGAESLEQRLSNVLSHSRRSSVLAPASRRKSYWPGSDTLSQGLLLPSTRSKLARLAREAAFRSLPRSKASKKREMMNPMATQIRVTQQHLVDPLVQEGEVENGELSPPLSSRRSEDEIQNDDNILLEPSEESTIPEEQTDNHLPRSLGIKWRPEIGRSSHGSLMGIGGHQKRVSLLADGPSNGPMIPGIRVGKKAKEGSRRHSKLSDDETLPLLGTD